MKSYQAELNQIIVLTVAGMKARYRKTLMGFIWVILNPLVMFSAQAFVFKKVLRIDYPDYYVFLLGGLLPWIFLNSCWDSCTSSLVTSSAVIRSFQISPVVIVAANILNNFINFLASFLLIGAPAIILSGKGAWGMLFLPLAIIVLAGFTVTTTVLFAVLHVFYRDVKFVVQFCMSVLFFLTPIFYPKSFIPLEFQWLVELNPIYLVIAPFRAALYGESSLAIMLHLVKGTALGAVSGCALVWCWRRKKNELLLRL